MTLIGVLKTMVVQRERMQGGKAGEDSHRKFNAGWKTGRPWLDFRQVATTTTDLDSAGNSVLVTAMWRGFSPAFGTMLCLKPAISHHLQNIGRPGQALGRCGCAVTSVLQRGCGGAVC
jgi:hypothetical protein